MNDTPETDKQHEVAKSCGFPLMVQADFARKMERQRDMLRAALEHIRRDQDRPMSMRVASPAAIATDALNGSYRG